MSRLRPQYLVTGLLFVLSAAVFAQTKQVKIEPIQSTTAHTGADLFRDLISLRQNLSSGNTSAITSTDTPNLTTDENHLVSGIAANGVLQSALESASTNSTNLGTNLTTQTSNLTSANLATTLTKLSQTQTAYQAAMQSGVLIMNLSILDFIQ